MVYEGIRKIAITIPLLNNVSSAMMIRNPLIADFLGELCLLA